MRASDRSSSSSSTSAAAAAAAAGAPRIASGNCSVALSASSASSRPPTAADVYEKQLAWKLHGQRKLQQKSQELATLEDHACTFTPHVRRSLRDADIEQQETAYAYR